MRVSDSQFTLLMNESDVAVIMLALKVLVASRVDDAKSTTITATAVALFDELERGTEVTDAEGGDIWASDTDRTLLGG